MNKFSVLYMLILVKNRSNEKAKICKVQTETMPLLKNWNQKSEIEYKNFKRLSESIKKRFPKITLF